MAVRVAILLAVVIAAVSANPSLSAVEYINSIQDSWTAEVTDLSGKSWEYKKRLCGALSPKPGHQLPIKKVHIVGDIPFNFDAREQWPNCHSIHSIKNQGACGSCWAVGAASAASDRLCIATHVRVMLNISVENLMTCCSECVETGGCDGGYPHKAWDYLQHTGVVTGGDYDSNEGCQPYQIAPNSSVYCTPPCSKKCTNKKYGRAYNKDLHSDKNAYLLKPKDVKAMQSEILQYGPIEATFKVYEDFFNYKSGVYKHTSTVLVGRHAVKVLGWGIENDQDYWLVANSWGRTFGINGFFKIVRGTNECEFEQEVYAGLPKF